MWWLSLGPAEVMTWSRLWGGSSVAGAPVSIGIPVVPTRRQYLSQKVLHVGLLLLYSRILFLKKAAVLSGLGLLSLQQGSQLVECLGSRLSPGVHTATHCAM